MLSSRIYVHVQIQSIYVSVVFRLIYYVVVYHAVVLLGKISPFFLTPLDYFNSSERIVYVPANEPMYPTQGRGFIIREPVSRY